MTASKRGLPSLVVLAGATASGKSSLALELCERLEAELLSADSQQVYRGMDIGTAKPDAAQQARVPHHGIDLVEPDRQLSVAEFVEAADAAIAKIQARGRRVLVVGGTGLWVRALLRGLAAAPPRDEGLRARLEVWLAKEGSPALHARLAARDPTSAERLHPNDHVRIVRALEVIELTGEPLSARQEAHGFQEARYRYRHLALRLPRERHRARIRARVEAMLAAGWLEESRGLIAAGHTERLRKVLGYAQILACFDGEFPEAELVDRITAKTWAYAKRQRTWLRSEPELEWLEVGEAGARALAGPLGADLEDWFVGSKSLGC